MYVLDSTAIGLMSHPIGRPMTILYMTCSPELSSTMSLLPHHRSSSPISFRLIADTTTLKSSPVTSSLQCQSPHSQEYEEHIHRLIRLLISFFPLRILAAHASGRGSGEVPVRLTLSGREQFAAYIGLWTRNSSSSRLKI